MRYACGMDAEKVAILSENDPAFSQFIRRLLFVDDAEQADLATRRHIDAMATEIFGDGLRAILIEVEANRPRHRPSLH